MTANEFAAACTSRTIDPSVALENEKLKAALLARDDKAVTEILDTEF